MSELWVRGQQVRLSIGGSSPTLVDVSLSKTLHPEVLPVAVSTLYDYLRIENAEETLLENKGKQFPSSVASHESPR
ncbi:hypothetical protein EYF80_044353 [Liparis tanakae]|uniref:Uncharacterized protein n=1 Tax=Liparis tanakae TaxID=230148 RepID=A0A4Z2FW10_9TELE|nr:hypothetical protein EYF80_044353 [Liparis tanakae]